MSIFDKLFKRNKPLSLDGFVDWHSHILPGVDDGISELEDSLEVLGIYETLGIKEVWLTPHIMEDIPNTPDKLRERFGILKDAYTGGVKLNLAAENMIDSLFMERLASGDLLTIGNEGNTLLVETSYFNAPMKFYETLELIRKKGYNPLLAHPERYYYIDNMATYRRLKDMGVRFQLNLMSLTGHYGPQVKDKAQKLLAEGCYDRAGTDLHSLAHLDELKAVKLPEAILTQLSYLL